LRANILPDHVTARVIQCVAIIPILRKNRLDYDHAVIAEPKSLGILGPFG
jgi:hypothetical protein